MRIARLGFCLAGLLCLVFPRTVSAGGATLYGASGDLGEGLFGRIDQTTGVFTQTGTTPTGNNMPALACNAAQQLFGSENRVPTSPLTAVSGSSCGFLVSLDPSDGSVNQSFGFITLAGSPNSCLRISDFDFNPASGVLYGVGRGSQSRDGLFTITVASPPVATLVGLLDPTCTTNCLQRGGLAFRDDGALFLLSIDERVARLNPADASVIGSILTPNGPCFEAATFRNIDDLLYAAECDGETLYTVDETTGVATVLNADPGDDSASLANCGDRVGIVGGVTPTPTVPAPTPTRTATPDSGAAPAAVPTMSGFATVIFGLLLAAGALVFLRMRS